MPFSFSHSKKSSSIARVATERSDLQETQSELAAGSTPHQLTRNSSGLSSAGSARKRGSVSFDSVPMIHKPLNRIVSLIPPTSSLHDNYNQDIQRMSVENLSLPLPLGRVVRPTGSLRSLVCGNPASVEDTRTSNCVDLLKLVEDSKSISHVSLVLRKQSSLAVQTEDPPPSTFTLPTPLGIPLTAWLCMLIGSACCLAISRTSSLFLGIICGGFMVFVVLRSYTWLLSPKIVYVYVPFGSDDSWKKLSDTSLQNMPRNSNEATEQSVREFQGWLNVLEDQEYSQHTYHLSNTEVVYSRLEGTSFRMKKPLEADLPKRAIWNEPVHSITFVKQIKVDMTSYEVELRPKSLPESLLYNKRYPICLLHKRAIQADEERMAESLFNKYSSTSAPLKCPDLIVLFARTDREKEDWFRRLDQASRGFPVTTMVLELKRLADLAEKDADADLASSLVKGPGNTGHSAKKKGLLLLNRDHMEMLVDYLKYMLNVIAKGSNMENADTAKTVPSDSRSTWLSRDGKSPDRISFGSKRGRSKSPQDPKSSQPYLDLHHTVQITDCDTGTIWVNALLQRVFFDFFREEYWSDKMRSKLQKKLNKISLPYYLGALLIGNLHLGKNLPLIKRIGQPYLSDDGLWIDSQLAYSGGAQMTIETKINLNGLRNTPDNVCRKPNSTAIVRRSALDEDSNSSDESINSEIDFVITPLDKDPKKGEYAVTKFFNVLKDSKYFQKLAKTKLITSAFDKVSKMPLKLTVEVKYIAGIFSVNIPPPPTDRIWFGFRGAPDLILTAKPVVGEKSVNLNKLSLWIEEKLTTEFQKEFVIPNMVSFAVPVMCGNYTSVPTRSRSKRMKNPGSAVNCHQSE